MKPPTPQKIAHNILHPLCDDAKISDVRNYLISAIALAISLERKAHAPKDVTESAREE